jgi:hypothetical protein
MDCEEEWGDFIDQFMISGLLSPGTIILKAEIHYNSVPFYAKPWKERCTNCAFSTVSAISYVSIFTISFQTFTVLTFCQLVFNFFQGFSLGFRELLPYVQKSRHANQAVDPECT